MNVWRPLSLIGTAAVVCMALAACGGASSGSSGTSGNDSGPRITVLLPTLQNEAYLRVKSGAEAEAAKHPAATVDIEAGTDISNANDLIAKIDAALTKGTQAIAVDAGAVPDQLVPSLEKAIQQGVPVIPFDVSIPSLKGQTTYVGLDNERSTVAAGRFVSKQLPQGGDVGIVACVKGNPITDARIAGFQKGLASGVRIVSTLDAQCDAEKARSVTQNMLTAHPDLKAIFSTSDGQLPGVTQALAAAHKDLVVIGYDGQEPALTQIAKGDVVDGTVENQFEQQGADAVKWAIAAADHQPVPKRVTVPTIFIDKSNVDAVLSRVRASKAKAEHAS